MEQVLGIRSFALVLLALVLSSSAFSQPYLPKIPSLIRDKASEQRSLEWPCQSTLDDLAQDAEDQMVPAHGGLDPQGRPVWAHQVQRRQKGDTALSFTGWVIMLTDEVSQRWWNQEDGAAQWTSMTEQIGVFRSRYQRYENGWLVEQVGFYANGQLDHHFHMGRDGRNVGSQRMWYPNGQPYIDQFHDEDGLLHGPQWRWRSDGVLDRG
ncbi:MAG: hypothetical protein L7S67_07015, partial [Flavobacteriales bacterium]|nr:hypothetical protein [Flavobacteriales bacterium]